MTLWIVGQSLNAPLGSTWDFQGVFSSEAKACTACRTDAYFVFSVELDGELPHESQLPPDIWYPLRGRLAS